MKYFFLTEGWITDRVWSPDGLWLEAEWRRKPLIEQLTIAIEENGERLLLYRVEPAVLMVEVKPDPKIDRPGIGQVVLKRLMEADQVIDRLAQLNIGLD